MTLTPTNARLAPTAVITTAGALAAYDRALAIGSPESYQQAADMLADVVRRVQKNKPIQQNNGDIRLTPPAAVQAAAKRKAAERAPVQAGIFNAQNLYAALERITRAMEMRAAIPILTFVRFRVTKGRAQVSGTDLDMEVIETLSDCDMPDCDICLPAKALLDALKGTRGGIKLEIGETNSVLDVGGVKHVMSQNETRDMPAIPAQRPLATFFMQAQDLRDKLAFVATGMSKEETRYYLNGAFIHLYTEAGQDVLTTVATDGHRLFRDQTPAPTISGEIDAVRTGMILPHKAVTWLIRNLPKTGEVRIVMSKAKEAEAGRATAFSVHVGDTVMTTKAIDGSFPDYHRVIPRADAANRAAVVSITDTSAAAEVITRVAKVSNEKSRAGKFQVSKDGVSVLVRNMEGGKAEAEIPACGAAGGNVEIGFNIAYVLDAIGKAPAVNIVISGPADPSRVEYPSHPGRVSVLMPLRV